MMKRLVTGTVVALAIASGPAFACAEPPPAHVVHEAKSKAAAIEAKLKTAEPSVEAKARMVHPVVEAKLKTVRPAVDAKSKTVDPAVEAKFEAVDEDNSGSLDGPEVEAYKPAMVQIDTDKDGKISREEFAAAVTAGTIK
jgi:EF hand